MVRFSCFQAHIHSHKYKKPVQNYTEAMRKKQEDSSPKQDLSNSSDFTTENRQCSKEEGHMHYSIADRETDYSPTENDCRYEEMEGKHSSDCDIMVHKNAQMRKSQSLGSGLNWVEKTSVADGSDEEIEQRFSYDGSADRCRSVVPDSVNNNGLSLSDQFQEPMPSVSVQVNSDITKNVSIFSIGDQEQTEKEDANKGDNYASGDGDSGDVTPHTPHVIVKSSSLPRLGSPTRFSTSFLPHSKSAEDMSTLDSRKKVQYQERENPMHDTDKNTGENPAEEMYENYNFVDSAKDWIIPVSDGVNRDKVIKGETSFNNWNEVPAKDFRLKRIEEWVINLQQCGPLEEEESSESAPCYDQDISKDETLLQEPSLKSEVNVNPGIEHAKRYISSLNPSATAAQLTNLGLVVIPFLSAFNGLKALNLSGNFIVRIAAGALPRGLHILNLSKNNISTIEGLRDLTRLRVLDLSYNRILRIGHGLAACSSIKELYLAGNKISEVEGLHRLLKLNVLDLRFNKISTTKCLGQLAANYNCLHAFSLEGNPAQKNVGDEQLKKYVLGLLPHLSYYNRQSIKLGATKDAAERSARLGIASHQMDRSHRVEAKTVRKASHGLATQKVASSSHGRKSQPLGSHKPSRSRHGRLPPSGMKTTGQGYQFGESSSMLVSLRNDFGILRSRSEGNLGGL